MKVNPDEGYFIRPLTGADCAQLGVFYRSLSQAITRFFRPFAEINDETMQNHLDHARSEKHISLGLADKMGRIYGHAFVLSTDAPRPTFGIGLRDGLQGRGWGRRLMQAVLDDADSRGLPLVALTVVKNNEQAKSLYLKMGFVVRGETTFREENDSFYMERVAPPISPPAPRPLPSSKAP
jgi:GNAT superfamily N-acetyltransferase